jgi:Mycoplasma protein of unknown function, DUF285
MFSYNPVFNSNLAGWQVQKLSSLNTMFYDATSFNQNLCDWRTRLTSGAVFGQAFQNTLCPSQSDPNPATVGPYCAICPTLGFQNRAELRNAVIDAQAAGSDCGAVVYQTYGPMDAWDVSRVDSLEEVFHSKPGPFCPAGVVNLNTWDVSKVTSMRCR